MVTDHSFMNQDKNGQNMFDCRCLATSMALQMIQNNLSTNFNCKIEPCRPLYYKYYIVDHVHSKSEAYFTVNLKHLAVKQTNTSISKTHQTASQSSFYSKITPHRFCLL